ncbi:MAG: HesA/MoeB/ThiF family protein, partial [Cytophagales bacterium]|nr:HesA/MoeB/ThiF family protein [Cytophagales bacterium]
MERASTGSDERYARQLVLPEIGVVGQGKLEQARVLVVGAGGLGCPVLLYLAAAGVGHLGVADDDLVSLSNLQRQVLYIMDDLGKDKVHVARERLLALNPEVDITLIEEKITAQNAIEYLADYHCVVDATDNLPSRYLLSDACQLLGIPLVYGAVYRLEGQVSVFHLASARYPEGLSYRDLYPAPPPPEEAPDCSQVGVLGALTGMVGTMQALEVIKIICGGGEPLSGRLWVFDAMSGCSRTLVIPWQGSTKPVDGLIDYEAFCGHAPKADQRLIQVAEVEEWLAK